MKEWNCCLWQASWDPPENPRASADNQSYLWNITAHMLWCKVKTDINQWYTPQFGDWPEWPRHRRGSSYTDPQETAGERERERLMTPAHYRNKPDTGYFCVQHQTCLNIDLPYRERLRVSLIWAAFPKSIVSLRRSWFQWFLRPTKHAFGKCSSAHFFCLYTNR